MNEKIILTFTNNALKTYIKIITLTRCDGFHYGAKTKYTNISAIAERPNTNPNKNRTQNKYKPDSHKPSKSYKFFNKH